MNAYDNQQKNITQFTHLHVHSEYSLLDGFGRLEDLTDRVLALGMDSLALTDHGVLFGTIDFYKICKAKGIKPIIGCEVYVSPRRMDQKEGAQDMDAFHLVLLAENNQGYRNLCKIVSAGFVEGFYRKPRVDHALLKKYSEGLIVLSACIAGEIPRAIIEEQPKKAAEIIETYLDIFDRDHFFIEIQDHRMPEEAKANRELIRLAEKYQIGLVATNDAHYVLKSDAAAHDVLLCIQTASKVQDTDRMKFPNDEFYLKSPEEMAAQFPHLPEALNNTHKIAERCNVTFDLSTAHLPQFELPEGFETAADYVRYLCEKGIKKRYPVITAEIAERMDYELGVIHSMGFDNYFLVVWDFIKYAKDHGIPVGPGRGSAAGSLVAYALDITTLDPLKYNLLFERFLNPERVTMPDIDCDFCYERRQEVIDYVIKRYGKDRVAQIITFGTMAARGAVRDAGRAMDLPYAKVDKVAKEIPMHIGQPVTIKSAKEENPKLSAMAEEDPEINELLTTAEALEGLSRHASTHAAGVVIADAPLTEYVPLYRNGDAITTQYTMGHLEDLGLIKMDFLGLRTLTVIHDTVKNIAQSQQIHLELDQIPMDDPKVYEMLSRGDSLGVFQLESPGMISFIKELMPRNFEDIIAGISLYRPGPMDQIPRYIANKKNPEGIRYLHPLLEPILNVTYGCMVYQEQVMQIFRDLAGFTMGRSDLVRRAMSKKKTAVMDREGEVFIYGEKDAAGNVIVPGAVSRGVPEAAAKQIYAEMKDFAKYAFNKSHAAAYAVVAYQTAWLKCYYPREFMAALLSSVMDDTNKMVRYIEFCKRSNIEILPPSVNISQEKFSVRDEKIVIGLCAVKGIGEKPAEMIAEERKKNGEFKGFMDFCERVDLALINRRVMDNLIKAGAFDFTGYGRGQLLDSVGAVITRIQSEKKDRLSGQLSLLNTPEFDAGKKDIILSVLPDNLDQRLAFEKEVIGIYLSGHPLEKYAEILSRRTNFNTGMADDYETLINSGIKDGGRVTFGGMITKVRTQMTKTGKMMAILTIEDLYGQIDTVAFPQAHDRFKHLFNSEQPVLIQGKINFNEEMNISLYCEFMQILENDTDHSAETLSVKEQPVDYPIRSREKKNDQPVLILHFVDMMTVKTILPEIKIVLKQFSGKTPVILCLDTEKKRFTADEKLWVTLSDRLVTVLELRLGKGSVEIGGDREK